MDGTEEQLRYDLDAIKMQLRCNLDAKVAILMKFRCNIVAT